MVKRLSIFLVVLIAILTAVATANSDVLYTTFGGVLSNTGWTIGGTNYQQVGAPFTPTINARLDQIDFAAFYTSGTNQLAVNLQTDASGLPSGTIIESFDFTSSLSGPPTIHTANSVLRPLLTASTQYWVVLTADNLSASHFGWSQNTRGITGVAFNNDVTNFSWNYNSNITPAFDVYGIAVPEPGILILLGISMASVAGLRRWWKE